MFDSRASIEIILAVHIIFLYERGPTYYQNSKEAGFRTDQQLSNPYLKACTEIA